MKDRLLSVAATVLSVTNVLNWVFVGIFVAAALLSFPFADLVVAHLAVKYDAHRVGVALGGMRAMLLCSVFLGPIVHVILTRLRAIVATAQAGDPFVAANARRLHVVGWALLAIQFLDVGFGILTWRLMALHIDTGGWQPSFGGWLSVLMIFVLARVFTIGTQMRDELEMTV